MKGIVRIAAATPRLRLGDARANAAELVRLANDASADGAAAIVFPELSITGPNRVTLHCHTRLPQYVFEGPLRYGRGGIV